MLVRVQPSAPELIKNYLPAGRQANYELKNNKSIWILMLVILFGIHAYFVPKQNFFEWSEVEKIEIKQRMDEYPPRLYRLANILENRMKYFYRFEKIFFSYLSF